MVFSALLSFLGGSAFRMIWGELSSWLSKAQDQKFELERLNLQKELDDAEHTRTMESLRLQNELGLKMVEAQSEAAVEQEEARAFTEAMKNAFVKTGNAFIDAWNGGIRPAAATVVLVLWLAKLVVAKGVLDDWDKELSSAILGFFFADRSLGQRGK